MEGSDGYVAAGFFAKYSSLFTLPNALFVGVCEGWVKSEEYFMTPLFIKFSESRIPGGGLVLLSFMAGFTMPYGQSTGRYGASWLFLVRQ